MNGEQILNELKERRLPTFGTVGERRERLKKFFGVDGQDLGSGPGGPSSIQLQSQNTQKRSNCRDEIEKLK